MWQHCISMFHSDSWRKNWALGTGWLLVGFLFMAALIGFHAYPALTNQANAADLHNAMAVSGPVSPQEAVQVTTIPVSAAQVIQPTTQVSQPAVQPAEVNLTAGQTNTVAQTPAADSLDMVQNDLKSFIQEKQRKYISRSYGTSGSQCFTWVDLEQFKAGFEKIRTEIKGDTRLADITGRTQNLSDADRQTLLKAAAKVYAPTWSQMGYVDSKGNGQTDAGQQAEKMIAETIVNMIKTP